MISKGLWDQIVIILATKDVLYRLGRSDQYLGNNVWKEKDTFLKLLKKADTQFLVISIPSQSLGTYQIIRSLDVQEVRDPSNDRISVVKATARNHFGVLFGGNL